MEQKRYKRYRRKEPRVIYKYNGFVIMRLDEFTEAQSDGSYFWYEMLKYNKDTKKFECRKNKFDSNNRSIWKHEKKVQITRNHVVKSIKSGKWVEKYRTHNKTTKELSEYFKFLKKGDEFYENGFTHVVVQKSKYHIETQMNYFTKRELKEKIEDGLITVKKPVKPLHPNELTDTQRKGLEKIKDWMSTLQKEGIRFEHSIDRTKIKYIPADVDTYYIKFNGHNWRNKHTSFNKFWMLILRTLKQNHVKDVDKNHLNFIRQAYLLYHK